MTLQDLRSKNNIGRLFFRYIRFLFSTLSIKVTINNRFLGTHIRLDFFIRILVFVFENEIIMNISFINSWKYWWLSTNEAGTVRWIIFIILEQNIIEILEWIWKVRILLFELFHFAHSSIYFDNFLGECSFVELNLLRVLFH